MPSRTHGDTIVVHDRPGGQVRSRCSSGVNSMSMQTPNPPINRPPSSEHLGYVRRASHPTREPSKQSIRWRIAVVLLILGAVAWIVGAGSQAFVGSPHGASNASIRSQLSWLPTIFSHAPRNIGSFLSAALIVLAMALPGIAMTRLFRIEWHDKFERVTFSLAAGLAGWVPIVLIVGTFVGLSRIDVAVTTTLYILIPAAWILPALRGQWTGSLSDVLASLRPRVWKGTWWFDGLLLLVLLVFLYFVLLGALIPETQFDALWYHLGSAAHYVEVGHFFNIMAATHDPAMGLNPYQEISYTGFYSLGGAHAAKAFAFLDLPLICAAMVSFARVHVGSTRIGMIAALAFVSVPIAAWSASTASNDLPVALYTLLAVHALLRWYADPSRGWGYAYLGLAAAAFSSGVKAFGLLTLGLCLTLIMLTILFRPALRRRMSIKRLGIGVGTILLVCAAWWIRVGAMTGNPIFPLAYKIFPSQYWNHFAASGQNFGNRHVSLGTLPLGLVETLWNTVTNPVPYQVIAGPFFLVSIPLVLVLVLCTTSRPRVSFLLIGVFMLGWWVGWYVGGFTTSRYLVAIAPLACLWIAIGISDAIQNPRFGLVLPIVIIVGLTLAAIATTPLLTLDERGAVSPGVEGSIPYDWSYLYRNQPEAKVRLDDLPMVQFIDSHLNSATAKIFDNGGLYSSYEYLRPEMYDGSNYGSAASMRQWSLTDSTAFALLKANHVTHIVAPSAQVPYLMGIALCPHLVEIYHSPDHLNLYRISDTSNAERCMPPKTKVIKPTNGATLSGTAATLDATTPYATRVEFWLLGGPYGYTRHLIGTATPTLYGWLDRWNTKTVANSSYLLQSEAFNASGQAFSPGVTITVSN